MKYLNFVLLLLVYLSITFSTSAHDFEVGGIYYLKNGAKAIVTYRGSSYSEYSNEYIGSVNIPSTVTYNGTTYSVTSIGNYAFEECGSLTEVTIPNSVTSIGLRAFSGCSSLTSMVVESGNTEYDSRNNCNAIIETATNTLISGCKNTIIPNSVTSIGESAFSGCSGLTELIIPNSVTSIGDYAFNGCSGLTSVTIPNSVSSIGSYAFRDTQWYNDQPDGLVYSGMVAYKYKGTMPNGASIVLKDGCTGIAGSCFWGCSGLTSVTIPSSVKAIGSGAFSGCSSLTSIIVESGNTEYDSRNNCNAIIETATNTLISGCKNTVIPNSVTEICGSAFHGCSGLTEVTIPNSVTSIGYQAFYGCSGLTSVTIPNSVTEIGYRAFESCTGLKVISSELEDLSLVTMGNSVFDGVNKNNCKLWVPNGTSSIYKQTEQWKDFSNIVETSSINGLLYGINENGISVSALRCYFSGNILIPNSITIDANNYSVTSIGEDAFKGCIGLTSVTIPNSVTSIGSGAFNGCTNLRSIYSKILAPENVSYGTSIFNGVSINYCMLYVPVETLDSYQFTAPWNDFLNIIEYDYGPEFIMGDANGDGAIDVADYVDVASYILEQDPQPFNFAAADLDEDNTIDVGDLVGVAYLALNYEGKAECIMHNAQLTNEAREEGKLACAMPCKEEKRNSECIMHDNEECAMGAVVQGNEVIINLSNKVDITAMQMDINLPQGMTLVDASLSDRASASHQVAFNQLANGDYRLLASSSALKCFKNNDGTVLTLTLAGSPDGNGCLSGIKLAAPSSTCYGINDIEMNFTPTGIDNVTTTARIYSDGNNIIIDSPIDGTAQIVLPNGMNKTVKVATGRNVFETPAKGLIIVKMGNKVEKLQF